MTDNKLMMARTINSLLPDFLKGTILNTNNDSLTMNITCPKHSGCGGTLYFWEKYPNVNGTFKTGVFLHLGKGREVFLGPFIDIYTEDPAPLLGMVMKVVDFTRKDIAGSMLKRYAKLIENEDVVTRSLEIVGDTKDIKKCKTVLNSTVPSYDDLMKKFMEKQE